MFALANELAKAARKVNENTVTGKQKVEKEREGTREEKWLGKIYYNQK